MARRVTSKDKWKAKVWYEIHAPKEFGEVVVGETPASDPSLLPGRRLEVSAAEVAKGKRLHNVKLIFEITQVAGKTAKTKLAQYEILRSFLRSIVRRRRKKIELIKDYETANGKVRIKAVTVTARPCYRSQITAIREKMDELFAEEAKGRTTEELVADLLERKVQDSVREHANKVFPVAAAEVRRLEILS